MPIRISPHALVQAPAIDDTPPLAPAKPAADSVEALKPALFAEAMHAGMKAKGTPPFALESKVLTPAVKALLTTYDKFFTVGRPVERLLTHTAGIDAELRKATTRDAAIDLFGTSDFRRRLFTLEGALRIYRDHDEERIKPQYSALKAMEDASGGYAYAMTMTKKAREAKAPAAVITHLEAKEASARQALGVAIDAGWTLDKKGRYPALTALVNTLAKVEFAGDDEDRTYLQKQFKKELKDIEESQYDMNDLEQGIHELRRQMRWVTIYTEAVDGLVQHDEKKAPVIAEALADPVATSKYMTMPSADREAQPIVVSKSLYAKKMKAVLDLGAIKDLGEALHGLTDALAATGHANAENRAIALLGYTPEQLDLSGNAAKIYADLTQGGWLKQLRKQLSKDE